MIEALHHIQLAMPPDAEDRARDYYGAILGFEEVEKPRALQGRGGVWFSRPGVALHMGVQAPFVAATKAHPAFRVASLDKAIAHLERHNVAFRRDIDLPGLRRIYIDDPFGNRIELLEVTA